MRTMNRRQFVQSMMVAPAVLSAHAAQNSAVPSYLHGQAELYQRDPHAAALPGSRARGGVSLCITGSTANWAAASG
jgi:hypothetical protein